jgi:hypothetical protein
MTLPPDQLWIELLALAQGSRDSHEMCGLTLELTGARRQPRQGRLAKMYPVQPDGPAWGAVAGPVERPVRRRS